jgi:hypothetical protein
MADFWEEICQACSTGDLATFLAILESGSCFHNINPLKEGDHLGRYSEDPLRRSDVDRLVQLITLACNKKQPQPNILHYLFSYSSVKEYIGRGMPALPRIAIRSGSPEIVRLFPRADDTMANRWFGSFGPNALVCALRLKQPLCLPVIKVLPT